MPQEKIYKNWKAVTEADFVSLFIKTWFAYISTLRTMFPEAANRRGDGKYLNAYKDYYRTSGSKKLIVDDQIMASMEQVYREGRKVIMEQYPEYYLWDFYHVNEDFEYTFKDIPPDKSDCLIIGLKISRNRGTKWQFVISGFARFFGKYYEEYNGNVQFQCNISGILESSTEHVKENPTESEQDYLSWLLREINVALTHSIVEAFKLHYENNAYGKRLLVKIGNLEKRIISLIWQIFDLNAKDETFKTPDEMGRSRNTYELIQQRPLNYFQYHFDVNLTPQRDLSASEKEWFRKLHESRRQNSVLWFLDFVYRLRNALFHEIIDPLDEEWQVIFKNAYLVLHRRIYGQALIGELFFGGKIVIQRILDTVPIRIDYGVAVQHPLFLGDVVLPNLPGVTEHAFKQPAVDGEPLGR